MVNHRGVAEGASSSAILRGTVCLYSVVRTGSICQKKVHQSRRGSAGQAGRKPCPRAVGSCWRRPEWSSTRSGSDPLCPEHLPAVEQSCTGDQEQRRQHPAAWPGRPGSMGHAGIW